MPFTFKENSTTELKESITNTFLKAVSAFANFKSGTIYFGVTDDGKVMGVEEPEEKRLKIENIINDSISPLPKYKLTEHEIEGKTIIELAVTKGNDTPYMYKNKAYMRSDTASIPCDNFTLRKLLLGGMHIRYEELPYNGKCLEFTYLEKKLRKVVGIDDLSLDVIKTLGLYTDGDFNNAAAFLADTNTCRACGIDLVRFGENENIFLDRVTVEKQSLLKQYDVALEFFDKWYAPYEEVSGFYRVERVYIPREAYREAIANALCHRDFSINAQVRIAGYSDRVEITSPGGITEGITEFEFMEGAISSLRNETIAEVFHRLKLIEKFATGIKRIKSEYSMYAEKPRFKIYPSAITIVLPRIDYSLDYNRLSESEDETINHKNETINGKNETINYKNETVNDKNETINNDPLNGRKEKIVSLMKENKDITMGELAKSLGVSRSTVGRDIADLKKDGTVKREGSYKTGVWIIKKV